MWFLLFAQNDGFSDVTSGTGTIVVGLSAVIIAGSFDTMTGPLEVACYLSESVPLFTV